jgi:hypothetical protein
MNARGWYLRVVAILVASTSEVIPVATPRMMPGLALLRLETNRALTEAQALYRKVTEGQLCRSAAG